MQRVIHLLVVLCMLGTAFITSPAAAAQNDDLLDLANVPLPVQALPESGYQVLTGDFLDSSEAATLIAGARNLDQAQVFDSVVDVGLSRAYVLDLVLAEDRAWQDSPVMAVQQTSVYLLDEKTNTDQFTDLLTDHSASKYVTEKEPAVENGTTVATIGESGDMLRTVVSDGRVVIEVVSMDATGAPDETEHGLIVEGTLERLASVRSEVDGGRSSAALTLQHTDSTANFAHTQQTGRHGIYRLRDGVVQPAIGEIESRLPELPGGLQSHYFSSTAARTGGGTALVSVSLATFGSEDAAATWVDTVTAGDPAPLLADPYFMIDADEEWTQLEASGLYRLTGSFEGVRYSGSAEIRAEGETVVVVVYRSVGAALPGANITSLLMDHQMDCLDAEHACEPFDLAATLPPATAQASPVADGAGIGSAEFGWMLPELGPEWTMTEQFAEAGYDRVGLQNGVSLFEIESVINHHGEPVQCVLDELHLLQEFEEHADIRLWEDAAGNTEGGSTPTSAWVVYRVEPLAEERADQEYVIRIDCFTLSAGSANVVIKHIAPVDVWAEEAPKGDLIRDALVLPEAMVTHGKLPLSAHDRRTDMIHAQWVDTAA